MWISLTACVTAKCCPTGKPVQMLDHFTHLCYSAIHFDLEIKTRKLSELMEVLDLRDEQIPRRECWYRLFPEYGWQCWFGVCMRMQRHHLALLLSEPRLCGFTASCLNWTGRWSIMHSLSCQSVTSWLLPWVIVNTPHPFQAPCEVCNVRMCSVCVLPVWTPM